MEEKFRFISPGITNERINGTWSIKENLGHLTDLEPLWQGRLDDITSGKLELRATDLLNTRTSQANHNGASVEELLYNFRQSRTTTMISLEKLSEEQVFMSALHPRLKTPMRTMDLFLFVAEHDDHHLARITELVKIISYPV